MQGFAESLPTQAHITIACTLTSYYLHSSHRFLPTWGVVMLEKKKKKKKLASAYALLTLPFLLLQLRIAKSARTQSLATALRPAAVGFVSAVDVREHYRF